MKIDNALRMSDQKDILIAQGDDRVKIQELKTNHFKAQNKSLKISNDTLFRIYRKTHTIGSCDSLVIGQGKELSSNDSTINYQHKTIDDLKGIEVNLKQKCNARDTIIFIQQDQIKTINTDFAVYKTQTIKKERSSKFWSGVKNVGLTAMTVLLILKSL